MAKVELLKKPHNTKAKKMHSQIKWCSCGHLAQKHLSSGCKGIVEGTECEDHWRCQCRLTLKKLQDAMDIDNYG